MELGSIDVLVSLTDDEQKRIRRQILGKAPISREHVVVALAAAVQYRKNLATQLIFLPLLPLVFMPQADPGTSNIWWLMSIGFAAYGVAGPIGARDFRRTGRFLAETAGHARVPDLAATSRRHRHQHGPGAEPDWTVPWFRANTPPMSPATAAGRAISPAICGARDGGVMIIVAKPARTAGAATQMVTHSGFPRTCDQIAAASDVTEPRSMNSLPTRNRSMYAGTGS